MVTNEKRAAERLEIGANSSCAFASPVLEDFGPVKILNISLAGIGLLSKETLHVDLLLAITLANTAKKFERTKLVRIIHVTPRPDGSCMAGGQFETPLTYDELCSLVM